MSIQMYLERPPDPGGWLHLRRRSLVEMIIRDEEKSLLGGSHMRRTDQHITEREIEDREKSLLTTTNEFCLKVTAQEILLTHEQQ